LGINANKSKFHAAKDLFNLNYIQETRNQRKELTARYNDKLQS
jgi:dTDP-4-amino-4,6-dideoxygalactose transaminase